MELFLSLLSVANMSSLVLQLLQSSGIFLQFGARSGHSAIITFW